MADHNEMQMHEMHAQQQQQQQPMGQQQQQYPGPPPGAYAPPMFDPYGQPYQPNMHGYPMPPMMYPPQMMYHPSMSMGGPQGGPPSSQQQQPQQQQSGEPQQQQVADSGKDSGAQSSVEAVSKGVSHMSVSDEAKAASGSMSWAQIARDQSAPDQPSQAFTEASSEGAQAAEQQQQSSQGRGSFNNSANAASGNEQQQQQQQQHQRGSRNQAGNSSNSSSNNNNGPGRNWSTEVKTSARMFAAAKDAFMWSHQYHMNPFSVVCSQIDPAYHSLVFSGQPLPAGMELYDLTCKHLRTICNFGFLAFVNDDDAQLPQGIRKHFVVECANEMEVFQAIKRMAWVPDSPETEAKLTNAYAETIGVGHLFIFFKIPGLRKLSAVAQVVSPVITESAEHFVQLRWFFVRDIPIHNLKSVNFLNNPDIPHESRHQAAQSQAASSTEDEVEKDQSVVTNGTLETSESSEGAADKDTAAAAPSGESAEKKADSPQTENPKFYAVSTHAGNFALETMQRFKLNGGILLDFQEYLFAEQTGKAPRQSMLICGGPRPRTTTGPTRGRGRNLRFNGGGRGRGGQRGQGGSRNTSNNNNSHNNNSHNNNNNNNNNSSSSSNNNNNSNNTAPATAAANTSNSNNEASNSNQVHENKSRGGRGRGRGRSTRGGLDERRGGNSSRGRENTGGAREGREGGRGRDRDREGGARTGGNSNENTRAPRPSSRKVEGSDGAQTLRSQYQFEVQVKKGKGPKKPVASSKPVAAAEQAPAAEE